MRLIILKLKEFIFFSNFFIVILMPNPAGMLPPFSIQSVDNRAMASHCSMGIEPRVSSERIILLDTQVLF